MDGRADCYHTMIRWLACCLVATGLTAIMTTTLDASHRSCSQCGREAECRQVCRLKYEEKNVKIACWGCQSEDVCVGQPSRPRCEDCEAAADRQSADQLPDTKEATKKP